MTLKELMNGRTLDTDFKGRLRADDMVLAVNMNDATDVGDYLVAQPYIASHAGTLESGTEDKQYIRTGNVSSKTSTRRTIAVSGARYVGDEFQDAALSHAIKFGTGSSVVKDYVYFAIQNGVGEKGQATVVVAGDAEGDAGADLGFTMNLTSTGEPAEYTFTPGV